MHMFVEGYISTIVHYYCVDLTDAVIRLSVSNHTMASECTALFTLDSLMQACHGLANVMFQRHPFVHTIPRIPCLCALACLYEYI